MEFSAVDFTNYEEENDEYSGMQYEDEFDNYGPKLKVCMTPEEYEMYGHEDCGTKNNNEPLSGSAKSTNS